MVRTASLYQRVKQGESYPWQPVPMKGKRYIPDAEALSFGVRSTVNGKRTMQTFKTFADAMEILNVTNTAITAEENGLAAPASPQANAAKTAMGEAVDQYFANCEARGLDRKGIRTYRYAVGQFVQSCRKQFVEDVTKQDLIDFMGWLRKQPKPKRKHSNPERTYNNKCSHVTIFLKAFGKERLLKKSEYPSFDEKPVSAHTQDELETLYGGSDADQRFFLDFALTTAFRKGELQHAEYSDLKGNTLEVKRKPHFNEWHPKKHHARKITIPAFIADQIRQRAKASSCTLLFPSPEACAPDGHIDRRLETIAENAKAKFHVELHKLRKTVATRWAMAGIPVHVIQRMLGHKDLKTTQHYLADVDMGSEQMTKAVESAAFVPKATLQVVRTGTDGD